MTAAILARRSALATVIAMCLAGPAIAQGAQSSSPAGIVRAVGDPNRGETLTERWCAACHLSTPAGPGTDAAPTFDRVSQLARHDPDHIRAFLSRPHAPMPPLSLSRGEIEDIVAYLREKAVQPR